MDQLSKTNELIFKEYKLIQKEERNQLEIDFCNFINQNIIKNETTDKIIQDLTEHLKKEAQNSNSSNLFRIAYELIDLPDLGSHMENLNFLNKKEFWLFRKQITFTTMVNSFRSFENNQNRDQFKLLREFISKAEQLETLRYLPSIYKMAHLFHLNFTRQIDYQTSCSLKLEEYATNYPEFFETVQEGCVNFLKAWKVLGNQIRMNSNRKSVKSLESARLLKSLNLNNFQELPIGYFLANSSNEGFFCNL